ncbi:hypothetical protein AVEN_197315-1 [Araneus ventricosus]|uniref:Uncharacterized protein n=1 Tax=Araneus ventricosus TaxID=182803 RepID=A0A4Y2EWB5_ARAVE|nr:hypothetical protein AVEN_197315-1 [Araneus ventricosus]
MVVYYHGQEIHSEECRISDHASVFQAEIQSIAMALEFIQKMGYWDRVRIFSDSLSLQALGAVKNSNLQVWQLKQKCLAILQNRQI